MTTSPALRLGSLGAGVQSTTVALMSLAGELPSVDGWIFSDTGWEPRAVYDHLGRLEAELTRHGVPLYRVSAGNIRTDALDPDHRFASMPLYVQGEPWTCPECDGAGQVTPSAAAPVDDLYDPDTNTTLCRRCGGAGGGDGRGMIRRQCTSEYKLKPIKRKVRELLGYPHPTPVPRGVYVENWVGISADEIGRIRPSDVRYMRRVDPLVELLEPAMDRAACERWLRAAGWGSTAKSACVGCPFHGNRQWRELRDNSPEEWADAVAFDRAIRGGGARALARGDALLGEAFLHRSRVPLDQAPIDRVTSAEWRGRQGDILEAILDVEEEGDPDGCGPFACRSGEPVDLEPPARRTA